MKLIKPILSTALSLIFGAGCATTQDPIGKRKDWKPFFCNLPAKQLENLASAQGLDVYDIYNRNNKHIGIYMEGLTKYGAPLEGSNLGEILKDGNNHDGVQKLPSGWKAEKRSSSY